jgi:hypothetical protein
VRWWPALILVRWGQRTLQHHLCYQGSPKNRSELRKDFRGFEQSSNVYPFALQPFQICDLLGSAFSVSLRGYATIGRNFDRRALIYFGWNKPSKEQVAQANTTVTSKSHRAGATLQKHEDLCPPILGPLRKRQPLGLFLYNVALPIESWPMKTSIRMPALPNVGRKSVHLVMPFIRVCKSRIR